MNTAGGILFSVMLEPLMLLLIGRSFCTPPRYVYKAVKAHDWCPEYMQ
jgi:hypothetical protein